MLSAWLPERERVTAQSLMWAFTRWGGAVTPPVALLCIAWVGWRWSFVCFAALGFLWCAIFLAWFKDNPAHHRGVNDAEKELLANSIVLPQRGTAREGLFSLLVSRQVLVLYLQYFCFSYVWTFYITWLPTYLHEARGQSPARVATLAVLPLFFGGFGSLATGMAPRHISRRVIAFCGFLSTAILLVVFIHVRSVVPAMMAMGLGSLSSDLTLPISWDACVEIGGPYTATVSAAMNMMGNLAGFVAPVAGGMILEHSHGNWTVLIRSMVAAATISALCWLYLDPASVKRQRQEVSVEPRLA
jgi:sugar phosphate permease